MALYLCGRAALDVMRYLRSTNDGEIPGTPARPRRLGNALHTNRQLNELGEEAQRLLAHINGKVEALVPKPEQVTRTSRLETHLWSHAIPRGSFIDLGNGIYLSSPAFLFMQMATELGEVELILLGLELCGSYSFWRLPSPFGATRDDDLSDVTYELRPALTAANLKAFCLPPALSPSSPWRTRVAGAPVQREGQRDNLHYQHVPLSRPLLARPGR